MSTFGDLIAVLPLTIRTRLDDEQTAYLGGMLDATYGLPTRQYHDYGHIVDLVTLAIRFRSPHMSDPDFDALIVAIIFHDIVYELSAKPGFNENSSAAMAEMYGPGIFGDLNWQLVSDLIVATVHDGKLQRPEEQWIADLDLAGLSVDYPQFMKASESVIDEYSVLYPEMQVIAGRIDFLKRFLARPTIYYFDTFSEKVARDNMAKEIDRLTALLK